MTNYDAMNDTPNDTNVGPRPEDDMNYDIMDSMHDIDDISIMEGLLPNVRTGLLFWDLFDSTFVMNFS